MLSRETPGSFVRFHDDDSYGDLGAGAVGVAAAGGRGRRPISGYSRGSRGSAMMGDDDGDAYDDLSQVRRHSFDAVADSRRRTSTSGAALATGTDRRLSFP